MARNVAVNPAKGASSQLASSLSPRAPFFEGRSFRTLILPSKRRATACGLLLSAFFLLPTADCQQSTAAPTSQNSPSRIGPAAQELLARTVQALGGEAFLHVKSLTTKGRMYAIEEGSTSGFAPFESTVQFPDKRRFSYGKDKPVILVNDGERGWQLDKYGTIRQPPEQIRRWRASTRYGLDNLLRYLIHEPGLLVQDAGKDFIENLSARVVDMVDTQQVRVRLYVHAVTYLPIRISYRIQNPETREWDEFADVYGEYKPFQGVQTPTHITRLQNGERYAEVFRKAAEYDAAHPPNYFEPVR
jgi:hypothetical protein